MTILHQTHFISPRAELGKQEIIEFVRLQPEYLYELIQTINVAEEGSRPVPVPREVVHFLRTILHAAGDEHEFALQNIGLSSLDNAITESDAKAPDYKNLARNFLVLRAYIGQTLDGYSAGDFAAFIREAVSLAVSENFQVFSDESFDEIRRSNQQVKVRALQHEVASGSEWTAQKTWSSLEDRTDNWRERSYAKAAQTLSWRGAYG